MSKIRYTEEHHWLCLNDEGVVVVGITEHAQNQLGDIVYVQLPAVGQHLAEGDEAVVIESVKAASGIILPLQGEVVEVNAAVMEEPGLINDDPLHKGWLFKLHAVDLSPLDELMDPVAYQSYAG